MASPCSVFCVPPNPDTCPAEQCCTGAEKYHEWPELLGEGGIAVANKIQKNFPNLKLCYMLEGTPRPTDICCNRVILVVDTNNTIVIIPRIG